MRIRWTILFSIIVAAVVAASSSSLAKDYAFLVGVQNYDVKQLSKLNYARNDIQEFHQALVNSGYDPEDVVLMHDDLSSLSSIRFAPLAANVRKELKLLLGTLEPEDSVIVAFAGHGVQFKGENQNYFCPLDVDLADTTRKSLVSLTNIYDELGKTKARKRLLLVDACRNDPRSQLARSISDVRIESVSRPQLTRPPAGVVALFSCAAGQQAYEWPDFEHGVFFYHVLEAWRDTGSELTLDQLIAETKSETKQFARLNLGALQTPRQQGFFEGEWVLKKAPAISARFVLPAEPQSIVYVIGCTESMTNLDPSLASSKFDNVVSELLSATSRLEAQQSFSVICYGEDTFAFPDQPEPKLISASKANLEKLRNWISNLPLGGNRPPHEAIRRALDCDSDVIFVTSDSDIDAASAKSLIEYNLLKRNGKKIHCVGFGETLLPSLKLIAEETNGTYFRARTPNPIGR